MGVGEESLFFVGVPAKSLGDHTPLCAQGEHELDSMGYLKKERRHKLGKQV